MAFLVMHYNTTEKRYSTVYLVVSRHLEQDGHDAVAQTAYSGRFDFANTTSGAILSLLFSLTPSFGPCPSFSLPLFPPSRFQSARIYIFCSPRVHACVYFVTATSSSGTNPGTWYSQSTNRSVNHSLIPSLIPDMMINRQKGANHVGTFS